MPLFHPGRTHLNSFKQTLTYSGNSWLQIQEMIQLFVHTHTYTPICMYEVLATHCYAIDPYIYFTSGNH